MPVLQCPGEGLIARKCSASHAFDYDLHEVRLEVASGQLEVDGAIARLEEGELRPFTENTRTQLETCLGTIAAGGCPIFNQN